MRCRWKCLLVCLWLAPEFALAGGVGLQAHWLWSSRYPRGGETIRLRREFTVAGPIQHADLRGLADDRATVFIDGRNVAEFTSARRFATAKVASLKAGKHLLEIEATNQAGAAGVWLQLDWTDSDGQPQRLVTDGDWEVRDANGEWRRADLFTNGTIQMLKCDVAVERFSSPCQLILRPPVLPRHPAPRRCWESRIACLHLPAGRGTNAG